MSASSTKKKLKKVEVQNGTRRGDDEPSESSLREIPPVDEETGVSFGRGEEGLKLARGWTRAVRGRPKKGVRAGGTSTRSVRLQDAEWEAVDAFAKARNLTAHGALREAIVHWLARVQLKMDEQVATKRVQPKLDWRQTTKRISRVDAQSKPASSRARTSRARAG